MQNYFFPFPAGFPAGLASVFVEAAGAAAFAVDAGALPAGAPFAPGAGFASAVAAAAAGAAAG